MLSKYEEFVKTTDISDHYFQFYLDGMNEENGEISGVFKRMRRGDYRMQVAVQSVPPISNPESPCSTLPVSRRPAVSLLTMAFLLLVSAGCASHPHRALGTKLDRTASLRAGDGPTQFPAGFIGKIRFQIDGVLFFRPEKQTRTARTDRLSASANREKELAESLADPVVPFLARR